MKTRSLFLLVVLSAVTASPLLADDTWKLEKEKLEKQMVSPIKSQEELDRLLDRCEAFLEKNKEQITGIDKALFVGTLEENPNIRLDDDGHFVFVPAAPKPQIQTTVGIGAVLSGKANDNGYLPVVRVVKDSPAAKAGIAAGSIILAVGETSVKGMATPAVVALIAKQDKSFKLTFSKSAEKIAPIELKFTKEQVTGSVE